MLDSDSGSDGDPDFDPDDDPDNGRHVDCAAHHARSRRHVDATSDPRAGART
jgi:hypothetical protein